MDRSGKRKAVNALNNGMRDAQRPSAGREFFRARAAEAKAAEAKIEAKLAEAAREEYLLRLLLFAYENNISASDLMRMGRVKIGEDRVTSKRPSELFSEVPRRIRSTDRQSRSNIFPRSEHEFEVLQALYGLGRYEFPREAKWNSRRGNMPDEILAEFVKLVPRRDAEITDLQEPPAVQKLRIALQEPVTEER